MERTNDAKAYLQQLKSLNRLIDDKQEECDRLYARLTKITPTLQFAPGSGNSGKDSLGDGIVKLQTLRDEINAEIDRCVDLEKEINGVISSVENDRCRQVLRKRYVLFKTWEQIACEMNMTYRNVCYIHGEALLAVNEIVKRRESNKDEP